MLRIGMPGKELHERMNNIDAYLALIMDFAHRTGLFAFEIEEEADRFYRRFYEMPYRPEAANRSFAHPGMERR